jgi:tripartite-type tricarboxylate transporter receptor subunit TctC
MISSRMRAAWLGLAATVLALTPAAAEDFYKGKRINFIINFAAGGPTDIEGRLFAKYLVKHIAGEPGQVVQNMDGAGGMIGANYLAEVAPKDGTAVGYFTGSAWRYKMTPDKYRVDFKSYEFVGVQPGVSIAFARTDIPPGLKDATDIVKTKDVIAGGLGPENSKDLMIRLGLDMLGVPYGYVTSYRGSPAARLALQQREINFYAESPPSYRALVEPTLVKSGEVMPIWYDPIYDGEAFGVTRQLDGLSILPFHELYKKIKGSMPSGPLWDAYRAVITVNTAMQRLFVLPPGAPPAALAALSKAVLALNDDKAYQEDAVKTIGFVPDWQAGPDTNRRVRQALSGQPQARAFLNDYIQKRKK